MNSYKYRARDKQGTVSEGVMEAASESSAAAELRRQGMWITKIAEMGNGPEVADWQTSPLQAASLPSAVELGQFLAQLSSLLRSGINAHDAMSDLAERTGDTRLRRAAGEMAQGLAEGASIANEMRRYPYLFQAHVTGAVAAGESFGATAEVLNSLATQAATEAALWARLRWLKLYYGVVLVLAVLVMPFPLMVVRGIGWYGHLAATRLVPGIIAGGLALIVGQAILNMPAMARIKSSIGLNVPVFSSLVRWTALVRFCHTLQLSQRAGAPLGEGVQAAATATGHPQVAMRARGASRLIESGGGLADALTALRLLPKRIINVVGTAERAGNLEEALGNTIEWAEERRQASSNTITGGAVGGALGLAGVATLIALALAWSNYYSAIFERAGIE